MSQIASTITYIVVEECFLSDFWLMCSINANFARLSLWAIFLKNLKIFQLIRFSDNSKQIKLEEILLNVHERKPLQQTTDIVIKVQGVEASPSFDKKGNDSRRQNDGTANISFVYKLKYKQTMKAEESN